MKRALKVLGVGLLALVLLAVAAGFWLDSPRPDGRPGAEADALARRMARAVDAEAWARTQAVRFVFAGRNHHLWDRARGYASVAWDDVQVVFDIDARRGFAWREGARLADPGELIDDAHAAWVNDTFWLNPVVKSFEPGVARGLVDEDEVLVTFGWGGRTRGDAYLWPVGADGRPTAWRMWLSIIPIGGLKVTWGGWIELSTGAWVATEHALGPIDLRLSQVEGAASLAELLGDQPDPFAPLEQVSP